MEPQEDERLLAGRVLELVAAEALEEDGEDKTPQFNLLVAHISSVNSYAELSVVSKTTVYKFLNESQESNSAMPTPKKPVNSTVKANPYFLFLIPSSPK